MKVFILANGNGSRWGNYLNVPKPLIEIDGETLLSRMVRLCKKYGVDDITIIGEYKVDGAKNYINKSKTKREVFVEIAKISKTPFIMLNGDCFYSEAIIKDCINRKIEKWGHWENLKGNSFTGKKYSEGYIHKVVDLDWWIKELTEFNKKCNSGYINTELGNDWMINRWLYQIPLLFHQEYVSEFDILWEDETDDFDFPIDYENFMTFTKRRV